MKVYYQGFVFYRATDIILVEIEAVLLKCKIFDIVSEVIKHCNSIILGKLLLYINL